MNNILILNSRDEILRLNLDEIAFFEADGNYTTVYLSNKLHFMVGMSLLQIKNIINEKIADGNHFFARVGKRYVINMRYIVMVNTLKQTAVLTDYKGAVYNLEISREAAKSLKEAIKQTGI